MSEDERMSGLLIRNTLKADNQRFREIGALQGIKKNADVLGILLDLYDAMTLLARNETTSISPSDVLLGVGIDRFGDYTIPRRHN